MALDDVQHVEAAAIMRRALEEAETPPFMLTSATKIALTVWLDENPPARAAYRAAMSSMAGSDPR